MLNKFNTLNPFFVNKMDDENANKDKIVADLQAKYGTGCVPFNVDGGKCVLDDKTTDQYKQMAEAIATADESLMDKYFEDEGASFTDEEIRNGLVKAMAAGDVRPIFFGTATKSEGIETLLDFLVTYLHPYTDLGPKHAKNEKGEVIELKRDDSEAFSGQIFKTVVDPFAGKISYLKVMSGTLTASTALYNSKKDSADKATQAIKGAYDKAMENPEVKEFAEGITKAYNDAIKGINDFFEKPEIKDGIDKAKDVTIDYAEKAVAALKEWLKPEEEKKDEDNK